MVGLAKKIGAATTFKAELLGVYEGLKFAGRNSIRCLEL